MSDQAEYDKDLREFFKDRMAIGKPETRDHTWQSYQMWRIANALEALADTEIVRGIAESDDDEPWKRDRTDDEDE